MLPFSTAMKLAVIVGKYSQDKSGGTFYCEYTQMCCHEDGTNADVD